MDINQFITELETLCGCPDLGYMKCLEKVKELKKENEKLTGEDSPAYVALRVVHEELKKENKEMKEEAKKIEEAVRSADGDALELCLPIWYGEDEESDSDDETIIPESEDVGGIDVD